MLLRSRHETQDRVIKVSYVLSYRSPNYVRTRALTQALRRISNITLSEAINTSPTILRYLQTLYRLLKLRIAINPDCYILGFRGYELFWPVRLITLGKRLILDHMVSPYDSLVNERKSIKKGGLTDKVVYLYEKSVLRSADAILTDTPEHGEYLTELFPGISGKIHAIYVGTDENLFVKLGSTPPSAGRKPYFEVFFYGTFLPLHGIDVILKAAAAVRDKPIRFTLIGGRGKDIRGFVELMNQLKLDNIVYKEWVDYEMLPKMIAEADLCLGGPFGNSGQGKRVITGKTFQFLAMGKPTVVGKICGNHGFEDKRNCLLVSQGNEQELADAILWGFENPDKLYAIGQRAWELYMVAFSIDTIVKSLRPLILT